MTRANAQILQSADMQLTICLTILREIKVLHSVIFISNCTITVFPYANYCFTYGSYFARLN